jgi:hypothetical protein
MSKYVWRKDKAEGTKTKSGDEKICGEKIAKICVRIPLVSHV